jgi:subtilisin family serine protease
MGACKRNVGVFAAALAMIWALLLIGSANQSSFRVLSSEQSMVVVGSVFLGIGVASFLAVDGGFWTRTVLTSLGPAVAIPIAELISVAAGSPDGGYRGLSSIAGGVVAAALFLVCVLVEGPAYLWFERRRNRHLTTQSKLTRASAPPLSRTRS